MFLLKSTIRTLTQVRRSLTTLEHLKNRSLIRVSGAEVPDFLQGLITNDIHHLDHGMSSMYAMFLNTKGRVLYDSLIYKTAEENVFLIECDSRGVQSLIKHLKMYRVRRKIDVDNVEGEYDVYAMFSPEVLDDFDKDRNRVDGVVVPCDALNETEPEKKTGTLVLGDVLVYKDPRVAALGSRILAPKNSDVQKEISKISQISNDSDKNYKWFRYNLGVGEGMEDLPPNNCFPLEANCDYLHGVSFHKGCYIGQELTARTHHTGVVRKRLMPLFFKKELSKSVEDDKIIHDGVNLGKLRGVEKGAGLGLLRIAQAVGIKDIKIGDGIASTEKPNWWPLEAPKEKMAA